MCLSWGGGARPVAREAATSVVALIPILSCVFLLLVPVACDSDGQGRQIVAEPGEASPQTCGSDPAGTDEFDFIVVGSGAGGGPVASRLARSGCRVLLLEAGEDPGSKLQYQVPAMHALSTEDPDMAWWFFVGHHVEPNLDGTDSKATPEGILYPRGSALGGSTAVNAMVTVLPSRTDWNRLAQLTDDPSWRADAMDPYYDRVLEWLAVEIPDPSLATGDDTLVSYLMAAANVYADEAPLGSSLELGDLLGTLSELHRLLQLDVNDALRRGETSGLFRLPLATDRGHRNGTREVILDTADEGYPLTVKTGAFVTNLVWDDDGSKPRAVGVQYVEGSSIYEANLEPNTPPSDKHTARAKREVILAAGTFNTPQILMLSGVGDAPHLQELGLDVVVDLPGVGRNLQDRYEASVVSEFDRPFSIVENCRLGEDPALDPCVADWRDGSGPYQTPGFLASFLRRSTDDVPLADLQVFATPGDARGYYPGYSADALASKQRFSWLVLKGHTENRDGLVRLRSIDPFASPQIDFNYFDEFAPLADPDLAAVVEGVKFIRRIEAQMQANLVDDHLEEIWPGPEIETDEEIATFVRKETWGHHACGTSKMGPKDDRLAVVDTRFRVHGVDGLRIVDASVWPEIPGTFIALPTFMLSEKAADVILEDLP